MTAQGADELAEEGPCFLPDNRVPGCSSDGLIQDLGRGMRGERLKRGDPGEVGGRVEPGGARPSPGARSRYSAGGSPESTAIPSCKR